MNTALVFFFAPPFRWRLVPSRVLWRRWSWYRPRLIRLVLRATCGPTFHCAISDTHIALDTGPGGAKFWPADAYVAHVPDMTLIVQVPTPRPLDLAAFDNLPTTPVVPSLVRWLTLGRTRSRDCVAVVSDALRDAGVAVPRRIITPAALATWLCTRYTHATTA